MEIRTNYTYLAIGVSLKFIKLRYFPLTFYVGVRTGNLPDRKYKTSSSTLKKKKWIFVDKIILKTFEDRYSANRLERLLLLLTKRQGIWNLFQNRIVPPVGSEGFCFNTEAGKMNVGFRHTEETKRRMSESTKGQEFDKETLTRLQHIQWERKNPDSWARAMDIYSLYEAGCGSRSTVAVTGLHDRTIRTMWERFKKGWNPFEDPDFLSWPMAETPLGQSELDQLISDVKFHKEYVFKTRQWFKNPEIWGNAIALYDQWLQWGKPGNPTFAKNLDKSVSSIMGIHKRFRTGWNPRECLFYKKWLEAPMG